MGNPDAALASAGTAMVGETVIDTLDAIDRKSVQAMTPQEKEVIKSQEAKKALDQKTNKSLFKIEIRKRDIANLLTAFMLTFTTPDHLVAEAYSASQRAMDFNHDVSQLRAKDKEIEDEEEEKQKLAQIKETLKGHVVEGVELNFDGTLTPRRLAGLAAYVEAEQINGVPTENGNYSTLSFSKWS